MREGHRPSPTKGLPDKLQFGKHLSTSAALIRQLLQLLSVGDLHGAPGQGHHAFALEIPQHPGDHLPGGAQMGGDFFVGDFQNGGIFQLLLFQQEGGQPLVKALPHNLLHQPHQVGEVAADEVAGVGGCYASYRQRLHP